MFIMYQYGVVVPVGNFGSNCVHTCTTLLGTWYWSSVYIRIQYAR